MIRAISFSKKRMVLGNTKIMTSTDNMNLYGAGPFPQLHLGLFEMKSMRLLCEYLSTKTFSPLVVIKFTNYLLRPQQFNLQLIANDIPPYI